jgi:hypothetical protein
LSVGTPQKKKSFEESNVARRWKENGTGLNMADFIRNAQERNKCQNLVNNLMNIRVA